MTMNNPLGLYLHIPFCVRKCAYCDFCSIGGADRDLVERYASAICREISAATRAANGREVTSLFFGGGTPTYLPIDQIARIMGALRENFAIAADAEITIEANPGTVNRRSLEELLEMGFNRISIGVQSFCDGELAALGRIHTADEAETCVLDARAAGFRNINVDLMYAIPHQSRESFRESLRRALSLGVEHISAYSLIIEPGTPIGDRLDEYAAYLPDEDTELGMYEDAVAFLGDGGYDHYEISNYAHKGRECRHNMLYWSCGDYIGLGVAASSYFGGVRYKNTESIEEYVAHSRKCHPIAPCESEEISPDEREREYVMLSLRTARGVREENFRRRFGQGFYERYRERIEAIRAQDARLLVIDRDGVRLTDRGLYLSNSVINTIV